MQLLTAPLVKLVARGPAARFAAALRAPMDAQLAKLRAIVERNEDTEFGREHRFASIADVASFRSRVPVRDYERMRAAVDRMARGERNVLTAEDPVMFARTSGTTGQPKLIPVTRTCLKHDHADQMRAWIYNAAKDHPAIFDGSILSLVSPAEEGRTEGGLPYGATSGHIYLHMSPTVRRLYAVPYPVFALEDYAAKYYLLLRIGLVCDVTLLCTANPSSIVRLCEVADEHADELIADVRNGTVTAARHDAEGRDVLAGAQRVLRPDPERAAFLEQARARRGGRLLPADYWPHLALVGCWKGGTVTDALERLDEWLHPDGDGARVPVRDLGYLSSEARGSIPTSDEGSEGPLAVTTHFFEFASVSDVEGRPDDPSAWTMLDASEVEPGAEYYVFVTTSGGLYRYDMNDVVAVTGRRAATPVIEFRRKGRDTTSITGEKVTANQVIQAFEGATRALGIRFDHYKAEADAATALYRFKVECRRRPGADVERRLLDDLDRRLGELNVEYKSKRDSERLHPPVLLVMASGWGRETAKRDLRDFQRKEVRLSPADDGDQHHVQETITSEAPERRS